MRLTSLLSIIALTVAFAQAEGVDQPTSSDVVVSFETNPQLVVGEPGIVGLVIRNRSDEAVTVDLGWDRRDSLRVRVTRPDGSHIDGPRLAQAGVSRIPTVRIPARGTYAQQYVLNEWVSLDEPGTYEVELRLDASWRTTEGPNPAPSARTILGVRVNPRDAVHLRRTCDLLAEQALRAPTVSAQHDAARALSYVRDSVAVPCIDKVLKATTRFDPSLTQALVRIGTESARATLEGILRSGDEERFRLAGDALQRFRLRIE